MPCKTSKRMHRTTSLWLLALSLTTVGIVGCGEVEQYGNAVEEDATADIGAILSTPASFDSMMVTVEGDIVTECPSGCWFELGEEGRAIYVDIAPKGLAIPQRVGKRAVVHGQVVLRDSRPMIVGEGVEIH